ncbi:MAG: YidC/Oxa1 family membrane protein insertase [Bacilli bacterium]|nr:YidC/Oxa1 family membrane protein insertase [Bacilli bacterium]
MRGKKILVILLLVLTLSLSGCTKYVKDDKGGVVRGSNGQNLVSNILCQPTDSKMIKIYKENDVKINKLPTCPNFKVSSGGYEGIWSTLFIKPLSWLIIKIGLFVKNYGLAIIIVTLLIRLIIFPISQKSAMQSENMKVASADIQKLQNKYKGKTSQEDQMKQAQEMMAIYKKYGINPMSGCLFAFIQMPLFFAFLESLYRIPAVFEGKFLMFNLGTSPFSALFGKTLSWSHFASSFSTGEWVYILLPIIVGLATYFSFKMNSGLNTGGSADQARQMKMMMNIMLIFIIIASFTMSVSIIIYWIVGSLFTIIQSYIIRRKKNNGSSKKRSKK